MNTVRHLGILCAVGFFTLVIAVTVSAQSPERPTAPASAPLVDGDPDPDEFVPDEVSPTLDLQELRKRVVYPDEARRANIEGMVVVRVLVDERGKPTKYRIDHTDNALLCDAAIIAVMNTTFTSGTVAGEVVKSWVSVPIKFELE